MRRLVVALLAVCPLIAATGISPDEYKARRAALHKTLDGVLVLFGASEPEDLHTSFYQETNFLYLTGWSEPDAVLIMSSKGDFFFLPERNATEENFKGHHLAAEDQDASEKTGFAWVLPRSALESRFAEMTAATPRVYTLPSDPQAQKLKALAPLHEDLSAEKMISYLRMVKSPAEIALIQNSTDISVAAHLAAWKMIQPGVYEYQIAATMRGVYLSRGCERDAYAPIVGSGPNSVVLHYMTNRRKVDSGESIVMDVGAECSAYATDITRTVPANGKFTPRQREIYDIVLGAQRAAIAAVKPGARVSGPGLSLNKIARDYIDSHGKDLHGNSLGKYLTHGISHHVGLDVHDLSDINVPLVPGMVITIEPGIYIPEENIGVRIEDTVVVTENGARVLSSALPREAEEIEKLVGK